MACCVPRVYGLAIMVYQQGVLNWLGFAALSNHGNDGALCWMAPTLAFSVMIGESVEKKCACGGDCLSYGGVLWGVLLCVCLCTGLGLDYDIFLLR